MNSQMHLYRESFQFVSVSFPDPIYAIYDHRSAKSVCVGGGGGGGGGVGAPINN